MDEFEIMLADLLKKQRKNALDFHEQALLAKVLKSIVKRA